MSVFFIDLIDSIFSIDSIGPIDSIFSIRPIDSIDPISLIGKQGRKTAQVTLRAPNDIFAQQK
jgi:hypothetical protein